MMSTYSGLMVRDDQKEEYLLSKRQVIMFKYAEPFVHHYLYIVPVYNHNYMCHDDGTKHQVVLENVYITQRWAIRVFEFLTAYTELNSFCVSSIF